MDVRIGDLSDMRFDLELGISHLRHDMGLRIHDSRFDLAGRLEI